MHSAEVSCSKNGVQSSSTFLNDDSCFFEGLKMWSNIMILLSISVKDVILFCFWVLIDSLKISIGRKTFHFVQTFFFWWGGRVFIALWCGRTHEWNKDRNCEYCFSFFPTLYVILWLFEMKIDDFQLKKRLFLEQNPSCPSGNAVLRFRIWMNSLLLPITPALPFRSNGHLW